MPYLGNRSKRCWYICHQRNQSGKFHAESKKFQFGTETTLFKLTLKKLLTYLKLAPSSLAKCKILGRRTKP